MGESLLRQTYSQSEILRSFRFGRSDESESSQAQAGTPLPQLQRVDTFWQNVLRGLFGSFQSRAGANSFEYGKLSDAAGRASERASSEGALIAEAPSAIGTRREREACSPRDSIVPGGGLRRRRALARQTEPRLCVGTLELG
jgi:hypothetical protein